MRRRKVEVGVTARIGGLMSWEKFRPPERVMLEAERTGRSAFEIMRAAGLREEDYLVAGSGGLYPNLIVDAGLDYWMGVGANPWFVEDASSVSSVVNSHRASVGTGTDEPAAGDVNLGNPLGSAGSRVACMSGSGFSPVPSREGKEYMQTLRNFEFNSDTWNGQLTEFGIWSGTAGGSVLLIRQLFRDLNGDPVTVVKATGEIVRVTHVSRGYFPETLVQEHNLADQDIKEASVGVDVLVGWLGPPSLANAVEFFKPDWSGSGDRSWTSLRAFTANPFAGDNPIAAEMLAEMASQHGITTARSSATVDSYTAGNFYRDVTYVWTPAGFVDDLYGFVLGVNTGQKWVLWLKDAPIEVTADERITFVVRYSLARHDPPE